MGKSDSEPVPMIAAEFLQENKNVQFPGTNVIRPNGSNSDQKYNLAQNAMLKRKSTHHFTATPSSVSLGKGLFGPLCFARNCDYIVWTLCLIDFSAFPSSWG